MTRGARSRPGRAQRLGRRRGGARSRRARRRGVQTFDKLLEEAKGFAKPFEAFDHVDALSRRAASPPRPPSGATTASRRGRDARRRHRAQAAEGVVAKLARGGARPRRRRRKLQAADAETEPRAGRGAARRLLHQRRERRAAQADGHLRDRRQLPGLAAACSANSPASSGCASAAARPMRSNARARPFRRRRGDPESFAAAKAERGALDFADQISRALALVTRSSAAWVLLQARLRPRPSADRRGAGQFGRAVAHRRALTDEFFAGESARAAQPHGLCGRRREAVDLLLPGRGAGEVRRDAALFRAAAPRGGQAVRQRAAELFLSLGAGHPRRRRPDFRTPERRGAASSPATSRRPPTRRSRRPRRCGNLATVAGGEGARARRLANAARRAGGATTPRSILARRIAEPIARLAEAQFARARDRRGPGSPRPIRPGDVMILVSRRNAFFEAMIRALKDRGVKVAGADRLKLDRAYRGHGPDRRRPGGADSGRRPDARLRPQIPADRPRRRRALSRSRPTGPARSRSRSRPPTRPRLRPPRARLAAWRARADRLGPFAFYARLIGEDGGRKALVGRLGDDATDPIDEFLAFALAHERSEAPSLTRFLAEVEADETEIKRDSRRRARASGC